MLDVDSVRDVRTSNVRDKSVVVRVDYNVSLGRGLKVVDDRRIKETLPTIRWLLKSGAKRVVLMAHLGRPGGVRVDELSLRPVAKHVEELLGERVGFVFDVEDVGMGSVVDGRVVLLENLRFWKGEKLNDASFARTLSKWGDVYVNDAFGASHRKHASIVGITDMLPSFAGIGLLSEVKVILDVVESGASPFCVIVGGAKVGSKIGLLFKLVERADVVLVGGGMANTLLKAKGFSIGSSRVESGLLDDAKELLDLGERLGKKIVLPSDVVVGDLDSGESYGVKKLEDISDGDYVLDIGPKTQVEFGKWIRNAKTIVWNGPMGVWESSLFRAGTEFVYYSLSENRDAFVLVGGGDTLSAISKEEHLDRIDYISTGGGAMLELIEKGSLPGIDVLVES